MITLAMVKWGGKILTCHLKIQLETEILLAANKTTGKKESFTRVNFCWSAKIEAKTRKFPCKIDEKDLFHEQLCSHC